MTASTRPWRRFAAALEFALQSLWSARRRMWLVVLGAAIGFGAIDSMLIIGSSVQAHLKASLDSLGGDVFSLDFSIDTIAEHPRGSPAPPSAFAAAQGGLTPLDPGSLLSLVRAQPEVEMATWVRRALACTKPGDDAGELEPFFVSQDAQALLSLQVASGRRLHPGDADGTNLVLGARAFDVLRAQRPGTSVGSILQYCGRSHRLVGVLHPHPGSDLVQALQVNGAALLASGAPVAGYRAPGQAMLVRLRPGTPAQEYGTRLLAQVRALVPGVTVNGTGAWDMIRLRQEQVATYARFLALLGGVSLMVGALGIANMMLVSVAERRHEIGLRMAIGAKRADILAQFVCEGVLLCAIGAALGFVLGWVVSVAALGSGGFTVSISGETVTYAALVAIACGVLSGAYPAYRAASVDPVASLHA